MPEFKKNLSFLELFIIDTLCYFDIFDYPLTLSELNNYLFVSGMEGDSYSIDDIKNCLETSVVLKNIIKNHHGFYCFAGRENIIDSREEKYRISLNKLKIAQRAAKIIRYLPFVEFLGVCNNLSLNNASIDSDIDFFIITKNKRLYLTRLLLTLVVGLAGLRRHRRKIKDRICLSFYVTKSALDLRPLMLDKNDIYFIYWLAWILPLYDRGGSRKLAEENIWIKQYLPNMDFVRSSPHFQIEDTESSRGLAKFLEFIFGGIVGDFWEWLARAIQQFKMSLNDKSLAGQGDTRVVIRPDILKFHENDRREYYRKIFEEKQQQILDRI